MTDATSKAELFAVFRPLVPDDLQVDDTLEAKATQFGAALRECINEIIEAANLGIYPHRDTNGNICYDDGPRLDLDERRAEIHVSFGKNKYVAFVMCVNVESARVLRGEDPVTGELVLYTFASHDAMLDEMEEDRDAFDLKYNSVVLIDNEYIFAEKMYPTSSDLIDNSMFPLSPDDLTVFLYKKSVYPVVDKSKVEDKTSAKVVDGYIVIPFVGKFRIGGKICPLPPSNGTVEIFQHSSITIEQLAEIMEKYSLSPVIKTSIFDHQIKGEVVHNVSYVNFKFAPLPISLHEYGGSSFIVASMIGYKNIKVEGEEVHLSFKMSREFAGKSKLTGRPGYQKPVSRNYGTSSTWRESRSDEYGSGSRAISNDGFKSVADSKKGPFRKTRY
jgi:hypothetical protein